VVMVGDGINDLQAFRKADVAILSEQQSKEKPLELCKAADYIVGSVREVVPIIRDLSGDAIVPI